MNTCLESSHAAPTVACLQFTADPGRVLGIGALTFGSSARRKSHMIQETSCPAGHLLRFIPKFSDHRQNFDHQGNRLWRIWVLSWDNHHTKVLFPSVLFRIPSPPSLSPSLLAFPPFSPPPSIGGLGRRHCLNTCLLGDASSPALIARLVRRAVGQPGWDQHEREAGVSGAQVPSYCISVVTKGCIGTGGGPSAQFNLLYDTDFIRGWWWKGKDSSVSLNLELNPRLKINVRSVSKYSAGTTLDEKGKPLRSYRLLIIITSISVKNPSRLIFGHENIQRCAQGNHN